MGWLSEAWHALRPPAAQSRAENSLVIQGKDRSHGRSRSGGTCGGRAADHRGGAAGGAEVPRIVDRYMDGKINSDDLITHRMPLARINDGFDLMLAGESIRSVVIH
jgi:threonine dehydrogenase-like Zn-dependent dehydrogenase